MYVMENMDNAYSRSMNRAYKLHCVDCAGNVCGNGMCTV